MNKFILLISLILLGSLIACSTKKPPDLISKEKFTQIMVDLELNKAYYQATRDSVSADSIRSELLRHYGITAKQYWETRSYYQKTGQEHDIIKKALDQLNHEKDKVDNYIRQKTDTTHKKQDIRVADTTRKSGKPQDHPPNQ